MGSEQGRISALLQESRACGAATALARARALQGAGGPCRGGPCAPGSAAGTDVPQESTRLNQRSAACARLAYISPYSCVPESIRLQRQQQEVQDVYAALGPYPRVFPAPCPPIEYTRYTLDENGNPVYYELGANTSGLEPVLQGKVCPLPNKPWNPVLPG